MTLRVFLLEDSTAQCAHLIEALVSRAKVEIVGVAQTECQAIRWLDRNADRWDILLVDLFLDEGTGVGVVEHCQDRQPGQKVLVVTNHARNDGLLHHCKQLGVDAVYHKSTELDEMVAYCKGLHRRKPLCDADSPVA